MPTKHANDAEMTIAFLWENQQFRNACQWVYWHVLLHHKIEFSQKTKKYIADNWIDFCRLSGWPCQRLIFPQFVYIITYTENIRGILKQTWIVPYRHLWYILPLFHQMRNRRCLNKGLFWHSNLWPDFLPLLDYPSWFTPKTKGVPQDTAYGHTETLQRRNSG